MTLQEIIRELEQFDRGMTIYAAHPWEPSAKALVARPRDDGDIPEEAVAAGCAYFLEVFVALGVLCGLPGVRGRAAGETEKCAGLIEYAEWLRSDATDYPFMKWNFPVEMMIYCDGCGKHFDIVVTSKEDTDHRCPACGKAQVFGLEAFIRKAIGGRARECGEKRRDADRRDGGTRTETGRVFIGQKQGKKAFDREWIAGEARTEQMVPQSYVTCDNLYSSLNIV